jgi:hypothetical protein
MCTASWPQVGAALCWMDGWMLAVPPAWMGAVLCRLNGWMLCCLNACCAVGPHTGLAACLLSVRDACLSFNVLRCTCTMLYCRHD